MKLTQEETRFLAGRPAMIHGLDTGFLVAAEVAEHAEHKAARNPLHFTVPA